MRGCNEEDDDLTNGVCEKEENATTSTTGQWAGEEKKTVARAMTTLIGVSLCLHLE
jgi:hypothetical protein